MKGLFKTVVENSKPEETTGELESVFQLQNAFQMHVNEPPLLYCAGCAGGQLLSECRGLD